MSTVKYVKIVTFPNWNLDEELTKLEFHILSVNVALCLDGNYFML